MSERARDTDNNVGMAVLVGTLATALRRCEELVSSEGGRGDRVEDILSKIDPDSLADVTCSRVEPDVRHISASRIDRDIMVATIEG